MLDTRYQAPDSALNGFTGRVCDFVAAIELDDVPQEVHKNAKHLILDGIACALVGAQLPWSRTATKGILEMEGSGNCTVIAWNQKLNLMSAAILNSTFIQGFELDDVYAEALWHADSVALPSFFAAVQHASWGIQGPENSDGASILLFTIVGFEIGSRLGLALYGSVMLSRGWQSGAIFGPCGLTAAEYEIMAKRMQHEFAARNGLFAALTSKENYIGIDKVFDRPHERFVSTFGNGCDHDEHYLPGKLIDGLGNNWKGMSGIRLKPYASKISTHAPIKCIAFLQQQYPERFADLECIQKIKVTLAEAPFAHGGHKVERPLNALGAQMSIRYTAAAQLFDGSVLMDQLNPDNFDRDDVWQLVNKIDCVWDRNFDKLSAWHTRVLVDFGKGYTVSHDVSSPDTYDDVLSNEGIRSMWSIPPDSVLSAERKDEIEETVLNMEALSDIRQ